MIDTMSTRDPMKRFLSKDASSREARTEAAEVTTSTVSMGVRWAEPSALPEVRAETIEAELDGIVSRWLAPKVTGFWQRRRPQPGWQLWNSPADDEPTAAANLRIVLVPHQAGSHTRGPGWHQGKAE